MGNSGGPGSGQAQQAYFDTQVGLAGKCGQLQLAVRTHNEEAGYPKKTGRPDGGKTIERFKVQDRRDGEK